MTYYPSINSPWKTFFATCFLTAFLTGFVTTTEGAEAKQTASKSKNGGFHYINASIENGSPLDWELTDEGIQVNFVYDQERDSPNRANGHWHFELQAEPGSNLTLLLNNFENIWNGHPGLAVRNETVCFVSDDGKQWRTTPTRFLKEKKQLEVQIHMNGPRLFVARLEPYRISDLERLKEAIKDHPSVEINTIGQTVQGRALEMIRVGKPDAKHCVAIRARAHPWEPGGNWVAEGLIRRLTSDTPDAKRFLSKYVIYVMPMANKDGVAAGRTRFNMQGMDLNRKWDKLSDPTLSPENFALETWLQQTLKERNIDLFIDFHNDDSGQIHLSHPEMSEAKLKAYLDRLNQFETLLRKHTWFTEGCTGRHFRNPGTIGEGLFERYGITACIHELNANHIAGLNAPPTAENWMLYGRQLADVFDRYFDGQ